MKRFAYLTLVVWLTIGIAIYFDVDFALSFVNAGVFLTGFLGLSVLGFKSVTHLCKKLTPSNWLGLPAAILSSVSIMVLGLIVSLSALLGSSVPFDSEPEYFPQADGLTCKAQIFGGATVTFNRVDISVLRTLFFGLQRKIAHQSWIAGGSEKVSLEEECSKLVSTSTLTRQSTWTLRNKAAQRR